MKKNKIALIGSGNIGGILALLSTQRYLGDVVMLDAFQDVATGKALDIAQANSADSINIKIRSANGYEDIEGADVVIVTAGFPRKEGMSRDDLLQKNAEVMRMVGENIKTYASNAFVIVITNPLDIMVGILQSASNIPHHKVVGMAGVLDASRFKHFLSEALNVAPSDIQSFVLGGHGDSMVPLPRFTTIAGIPLQYFIDKGKISQQTLDDIINRTRSGGGEIITYLKTSAYFAPAASALQMAASYLFDERKILPCAAYLNGEYGVNGLYVGVPAIIGRNGIEEVIDLPLNEKERVLFDASINSVKKLMDEAQNLNL
ncbi:MAG: malate dehydrogenase [Proteobacteria bacterium]|nr:malate dehydrogenase [Pseudomonadota bacterium]